eukprot:12434986-Ditylum_brightwellii.AAC.1
MEEFMSTSVEESISIEPQIMRPHSVTQCGSVNNLIPQGQTKHFHATDLFDVDQNGGLGILCHVATPFLVIEEPLADFF